MNKNSENQTTPAADLVAVDDAVSETVAAGGGDVAVFQAREDALAAIRDRAIALAGDDLECATKKSARWGGKRGATMLDNATRDHAIACKVARDSFYDALDSFAIGNDFLSMVNHDRVLEILGRRAQAARATYAAVFAAASKAGVEILPTPEGLTHNVPEMLASLTMIGVPAEVASEPVADAAA